jgi:aminopeptidase 2
VKLVIGDKTLTPEKKSYNEDTQTDTFTFGETLSQGTKATLKIDYVGELNDKMAGELRSFFITDSC